MERKTPTTKRKNLVADLSLFCSTQPVPTMAMEPLEFTEVPSFSAIDKQDKQLKMIYEAATRLGVQDARIRVLEEEKSDLVKSVKKLVDTLDLVHTVKKLVDKL